jgi:hypothetical protein
MNEKQTSVFSFKEIVHFDAEMIIWGKVTPKKAALIIL